MVDAAKIQSFFSDLMKHNFYVEMAQAQSALTHFVAQMSAKLNLILDFTEVLYGLGHLELTG
jgi:hypothetical protein